jgi:hypothetical protein
LRPGQPPEDLYVEFVAVAIEPGHVDVVAGEVGGGVEQLDRVLPADDVGRRVREQLLPLSRGEGVEEPLEGPQPGVGQDGEVKPGRLQFGVRIWRGL